MANPNPKDPNVPNRDVPEEDPYHLLDYDKEENPEMYIEEEEPEEDPLMEPEPLAGHRDQFDAHPNPQPGNMNGWVDDDDVEEEDDENMDVYIEEDDDADIIFPYEVQGDQTPPPRDESSDSEFEAEEADDELEVEEAGVEPEVEEAGVEPQVEEAGDKPEAEGADVELEAEEPDGAPEATMGSGVRDFPMGFHEAGKSSTARNPQFVGGLAPWALRRDLEALRRQERIREADSETSRTEIAFLGSEAKIGKMERFYLEMVRKGVVPKPPSDDEGSKRPRKMPKKIMPLKPMSEACMREIIRDQFATSMNEFMANMNSRAGGPGGASGSGGAGAVGLCQWFERLESLFQISECKEKDRVKFAMATLHGRALTWWNERTKAMGIEAANNTPWSEVKK
nr:putative reverse transcriptase domain-containing protein [Tanacetum cinerariifolium]